MSIQLERRAGTPRSIQTFAIPATPKLPQWFVRQFKLEEWESEWERWRQNTQNTIREALQSIQTQSQNEEG